MTKNLTYMITKRKERLINKCLRISFRPHKLEIPRYSIHSDNDEKGAYGPIHTENYE